MNILSSDLKKQHIKISDEIHSCKKIYLDINYWIKLRDAETQGTSEEKELLNILQSLVKSNNCILPLSEAIFLELLKQKDPIKRIMTANLIDTLSRGISIISLEERRELEFAYFIRKSQGNNCHDLDDLVWTNLNQLTHSEKSECSDNQEETTLTQIVHRISTNVTMIIFDHKDNVKLLNWAKERYSNQNKTFQAMFLSELGGYLDLFNEQLNEVIRKIYYWDTGKYLTEDDNSKIDSTIWTRAIFNLFKQQKITTEFPSISVFAELCASARWNKNRKYSDGNDMIDFIHATTALPYYDYFFTERELATVIKQRRLDQTFKCIVESDQKKIADYLLKQHVSA